MSLSLDDYVGRQVMVTPYSDDPFQHEFCGVVVKVRGCFLQVRDQDEDVWDVLPGQLTLVKEPLMPKPVPIECVLEGADMTFNTITVELPEGVSPAGLVIGQKVRVLL